MTEKPTSAALRAWLKTCPLIAEEQEATGAAFRIAGLDEDATAFSIEDSPGDPVVAEYFSGRDMAKNYLFLSRREYGEADVLTVQNSGFFERLTDWVMAQNDCNHLPALEPPRQPISVSVTSTGYIVTSSAGSCRMQMQLRLTYYQPK